MRHALTTLAACGLAFALGAALPVQEAKPEMPDMMQMMQLAQPGPEHEELLAGGEKETTLALKLWMMPGMDPMQMASEGSRRPVLGGRFLELRTSGEFMGMPMESISYLGYDRRNEEYTIVGLDTMGTYWVTARGNKNPETGVLELHGTDESPWGIERYRFDITLGEDGATKTEIFFYEQGGKVYDPPFKMAEMVSTPKK